MQASAAYRENVRVRENDPVGGASGPEDAARWRDGAIPTDPAAIAARERRLKRIQRLAWLLDSIITIPGINFRVGVDPLLGLIPVVGDAISMLLSLYIVYLGWKVGARRRIVALMLLNVAMDFVLGLMPVAGDVADAVFRANLRNARLLGITPRFP
jgi:hypothetical protein